MKDDDTVKQDEVDKAIEAVRAGDANAFSIVIQAYHVPVRAMMGALVSDKHDADDLAQQTFVFAFQNLEQYRAGTSCLAWLKAIGRNKVMAHFRDSSRSQQNLQNYRKQQILHRSSQLTGNAMDRRLDALGQCIQELPEDRRTFLRDANSREATLEEMAQKMGKSGAALRKQISRIYGALRQCVERKLRSNEV